MRRNLRETSLRRGCRGQEGLKVPGGSPGARRVPVFSNKSKEEKADMNRGCATVKTILARGNSYRFLSSTQPGLIFKAVLAGTSSGKPGQSEVGRRSKVQSQTLLNPRFRARLCLIQGAGPDLVKSPFQSSLEVPGVVLLSCHSPEPFGTTKSSFLFLFYSKLPAQTSPALRAELYFWGNVLNFHVVSEKGRGKRGWRKKSDCREAPKKFALP